MPVAIKKPNPTNLSSLPCFGGNNKNTGTPAEEK